MRTLFIFILLSSPLICNSQKNTLIEMSAIISVWAQFSSHQKAVGAKATVFTNYGQMQLSEQISFNFHFTTFGNISRQKEVQASICMLYGMGGKKQADHLNTDLLNNLSKRQHSLFYSYNIYNNNKKTSQQTGTLGFSIDNWKVYMENDLFGSPHSDKFRTAGFAVIYKRNQHHFSSKIILWTGDGFGKGANRINNSDYPARFGYKNLENAPGGKSSAGIVCIGYAYTDIQNQNYSTGIGIDAEQLRHFFQNKMMHDLPFLPSWMISYPMPHYPMLQANGTPYLFQNGQRIRPPKLYYSLTMNKSGFY